MDVQILKHVVSRVSGRDSGYALVKQESERNLRRALLVSAKKHISMSAVQDAQTANNSLGGDVGDIFVRSRLHQVRQAAGKRCSSLQNYVVLDAPLVKIIFVPTNVGFDLIHSREFLTEALHTLEITQHPVRHTDRLDLAGIPELD